ncbi:MAG: hypothetical protein Q8L68_04885 [Methylococcales bacterium]|nr:hypothetical protein [Methylococcales bacterium]
MDYRTSQLITESVEVLFGGKSAELSFWFDLQLELILQANSNITAGQRNQKEQF